jgi:TetR/AcrR family transcriptional regulator, mexJK operon transcriptional repressor
MVELHRRVEPADLPLRHALSRRKAFTCPYKPGTLAYDSIGYTIASHRYVNGLRPMKQWPADHPKARLLARKRAAILAAAEDAFLNLGYEGASMEGIAAAAGVSIMTLYRHARRKEELFAAIIANTCDHSGEDREALDAETERMSVEEILLEVGVLFQESLSRPQIAALLRVVITEARRFPNLAEMVHESFFAKWEANLDAVLGRKEQLEGVEPELRKRLCAAFFSQLVGTDALRVLMGMEGGSASSRVEHARDAADLFLQRSRELINRSGVA